MKFKQKSEQKSDTKSIYMSNDMIDLLVRQIGHELHNYTLYKTFANYYGAEGLLLLQEYYNLRANEEMLHHNWIVNFLNQRGVVFKYPTVAEVSEEFDDYKKPFELTINVEEETTKLIYAIVDLAQKENDWITLSWLMQNDEKTGALVLEQSEELDISETAYAIACQDGSWLQKEKSILAAYKK